MLAPYAGIDLQLHINDSDGTRAPTQRIDYLMRERFGLVTITDRERKDTIAALQQLAAEQQLLVFAAIEMSTSWKGEATETLATGLILQKMRCSLWHRVFRIAKTKAPERLIRTPTAKG